MISFVTLKTIARYEALTLWRSWFFRIFAILTLLILGIFDADFFTTLFPFSPWVFQALPSYAPYINAVFFNLATSFIAVFLAIDFLKRDKKLDTTQVVYMRSLSNADYVLGKTLGLVLVFAIFGLLVMAIPAIIQIFFSSQPFKPLLYVIYPLLQSVPSFLFVCGLAYFVMRLVGNQAIAFLILLGYAALTLFFLGPKFHYIFDYIGFYLPMVWSDITGFANLKLILLQRGIYLFLAIGLIFLTIWLLPRMPQTRIGRSLSLLLGILFILAGVGSGFTYYTYFEHGQNLRTDIQQNLLTIQNNENVTSVKYQLDWHHKGDHFSAQTLLTVTNPHSSALQEAWFTLNPGLELDSLTVNGLVASAHRKGNLIQVPLNPGLQPNGSLDLQFIYHGTIQDRACYSDIEETRWQEPFRIWLYNIEKALSFVRPNYVLLTSENQWYPEPAATQCKVLPPQSRMQFSQFDLTVETQPGLTVVSQGAPEVLTDNRIRFRPETPLPRISLIIGDFEKRSIEVDSVTYALYSLPEHNYFERYLSSVSDTLASVIRDAKQSYELKLGLDYPFKRFSLVEVPIQFSAFSHLGTLDWATQQPEMIFAPENGSIWRGADFNSAMRFMERRQERSNQVITETEKQARAFRQFIDFTLTGRNEWRFFGDQLEKVMPDYTAFPLFYSLVYEFESTEFPVFDSALEGFYKKKGMDSFEGPNARMFRQVTPEEKAAITLQDKSLIEILNQSDDPKLAQTTLNIKGDQLFTLLASYMGYRTFDERTNDLLSLHRFRTTPLNEFNALFDENEMNFTERLDQWQNQSAVPGFVFMDPKSYKVLDGDRERFQILFTLANPESVPGVAKIHIRQGGRRGPGRFGSDNEVESSEPDLLIRLDPHQQKRIGVILNMKPRVLNINTMVSKNLPVIQIGRASCRERV
jgi:ABC-type transport system involved in multi-copper enzyme maturation permease subunit